MSQSIRHEIVLHASPARVYAALTDGAEFAALTGAPAEIGAAEGSTFSCFGGRIHGRAVEFVPGARVVQAWRVKVWEPGVYSLARFELAAEGEGTRVTLDHVGFPEAMREHLDGGWHKNYLEPLKKRFA